jgi:hypothetical protein
MTLVKNSLDANNKYIMPKPPNSSGPPKPKQVGWGFDFHMSPGADKWFLILSNLAYLFPVGVVLYKWLMHSPSQPAKISGIVATQMIILLTFVALVSSWSYHACRGDVSEAEGIDIDEINPYEAELKACATCPNKPYNTLTWGTHIPGGKPVDLNVSKFIDHFFALFVILFVLMYSLPLKNHVRGVLLVISMTWMAWMLAASNDGAAFLPILFVTILFIGFWRNIRKSSGVKGAGFQGEWIGRNQAWGTAVACIFLAGIFFVVISRPYWLMHSLWHVFGALAAGFLLMKHAGRHEGLSSNAPGFFKAFMRTATMTPLSTQ